MFKILPQPNKIEIISDKTAFNLSKDSAITPLALTEDFCKFVGAFSGFSLKKGNAEKNAVILTLSDEFEDKEAYKIEAKIPAFIFPRAKKTVFFTACKRLNSSFCNQRASFPK